MSFVPTGTPAPGWYPDPAGSGGQRWWDGTAWTQHTVPPAGYQPAANQPVAYPPNNQPAAHAPNNQPAVNAPTAPAETYTPAYAPAYPLVVPTAIPRVPAGTPTYTWFIWVIVLLPLVSALLLPLANLSGYAEQLVLTTREATIPAYPPALILLSVFGWVAYLGTVALAFGDYRALSRWGYVRPFHWAWAFLSWPVYSIGRSVVVHRRSGRGLLPIWITIAVYLLGIIVSIVVIVDMFSVLFSGVRYASGV